MSASAERRGQSTPGVASRSRSEAGRVNVRSKTWLERDGKVVLSDWRVELLETIQETGSLARAAEKMEVPYRTAWYKLKEIEEQLGVKLLDTQSGGVDGGGSSLTAEAQQLIERFRRVYAGVADLVRQRFQAEFSDWLR